MEGNKNKHFLKYYTLSLLGCAAVFVFIMFAAAPVQAITISQLNVEINALPGETIEQLVQIYDESFAGSTVYPVVYNFTEAPDLEGSALIMTDPADLKPDRSWVKWSKDEVTTANIVEGDEDTAVETDEETDEDTDGDTDVDEEIESTYGQEEIPVKLPDEGTLADFPYRIEVPQDAEPGTHLISLVFQLKPAEQTITEGAAVYIGSNVAVNIFLKVLGATVDDIEVDFQSGVFGNKDPQVPAAERKNSFEPKKFFLKPPVDFLVKVDNKGNTHQKPDGRILIVNDLFGSSTPEQIKVNEENRIILPETDRTFEVSSFGRGFMFGKYRAKIELLYGDPLQAIEKEIDFWIVPLVEILIVLGAILLLIIIIIVIRRMRKKKRLRKEKEKEDEMRQKIVDELKGTKGGNKDKISKSPKEDKTAAKKSKRAAQNKAKEAKK